MGKVPRMKGKVSSGTVERVAAAKMNVKRKAGLKRGFSIAQSGNPPSEFPEIRAISLMTEKTDPSYDPS